MASAGISRADAGRFVPDVSYLGPGGPKLDLYVPAFDVNGPLLPALVWIHGNNQTKDTARAQDFCGTLAAEGFVCASIDYGPGDWLASLLECKNAIRFLRVNAATYHLDPARIAVVGMSMGGYYALMAGLTAGGDFEPAKPYPGVSNAVGAIVDFCGVVQRAPYSPPDFIRTGSPPILIVHGTADEKVSHEQSVRLDKALTAKGAKHQLILLEGVSHGFDLSPGPGNPLPMDLRPVVVAFLRESLGAGK